MPLVVVTSAEQGAGKTGVAAAIARHAAYGGQPVRLLRVASDDDRSSARQDAAWFGSLFFAPGSPAEPVPASDVNDDPAALVVVEADAGNVDLAGAQVVAVAREGGAPPVKDAAVAVVTRARGPLTWQGEGRGTTIRLPEHRTLNGFSVDEARQLLHAEVLVEGEDMDATCDYLVIAPIGSDAGQPYLKRFHTKAVVARFDKTDMHLAAMQTRPACLILTGGRRPSEYVFDAARAQGIPVLLSRTDTENTVIALERVFDRTRFAGERKLERMAELLAAAPLYDALGIATA